MSNRLRSFRLPRLAAALVLWLASIGNAQIADPSAKTVSIHFLVKDQAGQPVPGANIWIIEDSPSFPVVADLKHPSFSRSLTTDPAGHADAGCPAVAMNILATAPKCAPYFARAVVPVDRQTIPIVLTAGATVSGTVVDAGGQPIADCNILIQPPQSPLNYFQQFKVKATADAAGQFTLSHIADGSYQLLAEMSDGKKEFNVAPADVRITAGKGPAPLRLAAGMGSVLSGKITPPDGIDVTRQRIIVSVRLPAQFAQQILPHEDGEFTAGGIPAGSTGTISFRAAPGYETEIGWPSPPDGFKVLYGRVEFQKLPAGNYEGINITYKPDGTVHGVLTDENGKPVSGALVYAGLNIAGRETDAAGNFSVSVPPDRPMRLLISKRELESSPTELFTVASGATLEKNLTAHTLNDAQANNSVLSGEVVDAKGKAVAGARVYLGNSFVLPGQPIGLPDTKGYSWGGGMFSAAQTKSAADGSFKFDSLVAGKTDIWAFDPKTGWAVSRQAATNATDVKLTLAPQPAKLEYSGRLIAPDGSPIGGGHVWLLSGDPVRRTISASTQTDANGSFHLEAAPTSSSMPDLRLICSAADGRMAWQNLPRMSMDDLSIHFKPSATATGRVVDSVGQPVAGATVRLYLATDPDFGEMFFYEPTNSVAPMTTSGPDGRFKFGGLPLGSFVTLKATDAEHDEGDVWYMRLREATRDAGDLQMPDGIAINGTVRLISTGQPVAGARVQLSDVFGAFQTTASDSLGRYHIGGLPALRFRADLTLSADSGGSPAQWEGKRNFTGQPRPGDVIDEQDIRMDRSFAMRHAEWMAHAGAPESEKSLVAVIENSDPDMGDKAVYHNTATLYTAQGERRWQLGGLNSVMMTAVNAKDHTLAVGTYAGVVKINSDGSQAWSVPLEYAMGVAIDPSTSESWAVSSSGNGGISVFSPDGKLARHVAVSGNRIAYSAHDDCFWVAGRSLQKVSRDGNILASSSGGFPQVADLADISKSDGTVWVVEVRLSQLSQSRQRILKFNSDAQPLKEIDVPAFCLALDEPRGVIWAGCEDTLEKLDLSGKVLAEIPVRAGSLAVEPDTGCVWAGSPDGVYRIDPGGKYLWSGQSGPDSPKTVVLMPP